MKKRVISGFIGLCLLISCNTPEKQNVLKAEAVKKEIDNSPKVVLVTLDGVRWQEVFSGIDSVLMTDHEYVKDTMALKKTFWNSNPINRREVLMPFLWSTVKNKGQIYGNRTMGNYVNVANNHWFSYPGYSEILTGIVDDKRINSNDKINNPNVTILETVNQQYPTKVGAFGSWDVFPFIINRERAGIPINAGFEHATGGNLSEVEKNLNKFQDETPSPWSSVRLDVFTHNYALEYLKKEEPKLLYVAYGESDDFAHDGEYDAYIHAIKRSDEFIKELWNTLQSNPYYKDKTTLIITTDHGRGTMPLETWKHHGNKLKYHGEEFTIKGSDETWLAVIGPEYKALGEVKEKNQLYNKQIAKTVGDLLDVNTKGIANALDLPKK